MKLIFNFDALNQQKLKGSSVKPIWDCHIVKESIEWMLKQQWQVLIADENGLTLKKSNSYMPLKRILHLTLDFFLFHIIAL